MPPADSRNPDGPTAPQSALRRAGASLREHRTFFAAALICLITFVAVLTQGTGDIFADEYFCDFYDFQAKSLLEGRLDVPHEAIAFEAFVRDGKYYGYFGLTPALLRVPLVLLHVPGGHSSRALILAYFAAALVAAYLIFLTARRAFGPHANPPRALPVLVYVLSCGLGSTLFFLSSRAYIYHEAILCGAAFALWSAWGSLRWLAEGRRAWIGALACGILSIHARPPTGLFALGVLGAAAGIQMILSYRAANGTAGRFARLWRPGAVGIAAALGIASFNGVSYLKFRTFEGCPLRMNVQYSAPRLAKIDGRQFHLSNIPFNADVYLLRPHVAVSKYFPYLELAKPDPAESPRAKFDLAEPTLGFPYAMPSLFVGAVLSLIAVRHRPARALLATVWLGGLPMILAMLAAVAVSHRYTADFCPFFISAAACGIASIETFSARGRRLAERGLAALTALAIVVTLNLTLEHQGERIWGVPDRARQNYADLRRRVDTFFGVSEPMGYDHRHLAIWDVDVKTLAWSADVMSRNPARVNEAVIIFQRLTTIAPYHLIIRGRLGDILLNLGRPAEALEHYAVVVRFDPNDPIARHNLGVTLSALGRNDEAVRAFEAALRLKPDQAASRTALQQLGRLPPDK